MRGDGSTAHEGLFDLATGEFLRQTTHQGFRGDSCWSRGLAWALYGFGTAYRYTRDARFLQTAEACADFYIAHARRRRSALGFPGGGGDAQDRRHVGGGDCGGRAAAAMPRAAGSGEGLLLLVLRAEDSEDALPEPHGRNDAGWEGILRGGVYHIRKELGRARKA